MEILSLKNHITQEGKIQQQKLLSDLWQCNEAMGLELCYFVVDLATLGLKEKKGIYQTLGYFEEAFELSSFLNAIPKIQQPSFSLHQKILFNKLKSERANPCILQQKVIILHGLQRQNGDKLWVKNIGMPFRYSSTGVVTEYLYLIIVIGNYEGQMYQIRDTTHFQKDVVSSTLSFDLPFTRKEILLLREYAYNKTLTANGLALYWKCSYNTVLTHKNNALAKARAHLNLPFSSIRLLADSMREMGIV